MKASALFGADWEGDSVEVLWQDAGRAFCRLGRDDAERETHAFITITAGAGHPTPESANRLTHEYELQRYLDAEEPFLFECRSMDGRRARAVELT